MQLFHLIVFFGAFSSVLCYYDGKPCYLPKGEVTIKVYGIYLIGFTIFIMAVVITILAVALYMVMHNKSFFGKSIQRNSFVRQESNQGVTLCTVPSSSNFICQRCKDGSTLTVNSGIVEIGGLNEPETPTSKYDDKHVVPRDRATLRSDDPPMIAPKRALRAVPQNTMQKEQMDKIIEAVLKRKQKSDSATFRELDAISKPKSEKLQVSDSTKESKSPSLKELNAHEDSDDNTYQNATELDFRNELKSDVTSKKSEDHKSSNESLYQNSSELNLKSEVKPDVKIKVDDVKSEPVVFRTLERNKDLVDGKKNLDIKIPVQNDDDEQEVYDTLPTPVRCGVLDPDIEELIENMPVYDLPPSRSLEVSTEKRNVISKDTDTYYLLPLTKDDGDDKTSYVNAKYLK
ncbi:uncharacterized protein LOC142979365 [Anticarsia gemmatalis]|uniref:uncharacterized protein LOC142979365 n=1 Tax=Anticarsia gemmatalis TaxID=129554 RepID=UPI003F762548